MKRKHLILLLLAFIALMWGNVSCVNQNYIMLSDDEWSGADIDGDRSLANGELEMDDWDR
ncbi:MAG: hypothetical protein IKI19_01960 [Prevotella sp.]|nr:hypothetical protein [Prevotella sp.]